MSIVKVFPSEVSINKLPRRFSTAVAAAVALALLATSVQAAGQSTGQATNPGQSTETLKQPLSKEGKVGMASGAITGAFIAGPFGAAVGFIVGSIAGEHAGKVRATDKKATALANQLASTRQELAAAQAALSTVADKSGDDPMFAQLAQQLRADVLFRTASAELDATASSKLGELAAVLASYPGLAVEIDGYADPRGKSGENLELSQQRASAVRAALIVGGAKPESIRVTAHGEQLSMAAKDDMEAYSWERRVSLAVVPLTSVQAALAQ